MTADRVGRRSRLARLAAPAALVLLPILVKLPLLLGWLRADPMLLYSGLARDLLAGPFGGYPPYSTIDPNVAFTSQALGRRAALDVLGGHIPWWNPFEGVGSPLAGEMQSAALFPPTWLLALPDGQLYEHLLFQIVAGLAAYALLRALGLSRLPAFAGGAAFAFNGAFAWLANAVVNPVAFLPVLLLGIERVRAERRGGGALVALGLAASLYAGFPEVAYLDGLLAGTWFLARAATLRPRAAALFAARIVAAGAAGLAIAAPVLIAFADYLPAAELGAHAGSGFLGAHLDPAYALLLAMPYVTGGIFSAPIPEFWGSVGGYGGCALLTLAAAGVGPRRLWPLRVMLAAWVVVALGLTFGAPPVMWVARVVPGLRLAALDRYLPASWLMSLCVLAALALDDLRRDAGRARLAAGAALLVAGLAAGAAALRGSGQLVLTDPLAQGATALSLVVVAALAGLIAAPRLDARWRAAGLAGVLLAELLAWFIVPILSAPRGGTVELAGAGFLRAHAGLARTTTLGPMSPNGGSFFGIAQVNHNDLPIPRDWVAYVRRHLDPDAHPILFTGSFHADPAAPSPRDAFLAHVAEYAAIGVRYVLTPPGVAMPADRGLTQVFEDPVMRIFELADVAPYVSAPGCRIVAADRQTMAADCDAPAALTRLELFMDGWQATVNGAAAPVSPTREIFQSVALPAGHADIRFRFQPPYMPWGYAAAIAGLLALTAAASRRPKGSDRDGGKPRDDRELDHAGGAIETQRAA